VRLVALATLAMLAAPAGRGAAGLAVAADPSHRSLCRRRPVDLSARLVGAKLQQALGQAVVVENKPGAGGNLGADYARRARPTATRW